MKDYASKMTQKRGLLYVADSLRIPRIHRKVEKEVQLYEVVL